MKSTQAQAIEMSEANASDVIQTGSESERLVGTH